MTIVGAYSLGASGQVMSGKLLRQSLAGAFRSGSGATVISGCLAGPSNTMGELALLSNTQLTVQAFRALIANALDATAGPYLVPNDGQVTLGAADGFPAQDASQFRKAIVAVYVADAQVVGSGANQATLAIIGGALAASSGAAVLPTVPANTSGLILGELLIPPTGQNVTLTPYNPRTTTRGGILHLPTEAAANALVTGGVVLSRGSAFYAEDTKAHGFYDVTANRIVWFDTVWQTYTPAIATTAVANLWTPGNSTITGRYYRYGRKIDAEVQIVLGSTAAFGAGSAGIILIRPPDGVRPAAVWPGNGTIPVQGSSWVANGGNGAFGFVAIFGSTTPANRWFIFYQQASLALNGAVGSAGSWNMWTSGQAISFSASYETAFEA